MGAIIPMMEIRKFGSLIISVVYTRIFPAKLRLGEAANLGYPKLGV
jgi:hypothetical protein